MVIETTEIIEATEVTEVTCGDVWGEERVREGEEGGVVYAGPRSCSTQNSKVGKCAAFQLWTPTVF